jgi:thiamine biosynthesis protein ThiS
VRQRRRRFRFTGAQPDEPNISDGTTVQQLLEAMGYSYNLITVTVNGVLVAEEDYATQCVPDEAKVTVFHLAHGG